MKVILREDVEKLGKAGDIVKVADGYGRNFLIPKGMAVVADVRNVRVLEHNRRAIDARARKSRKSAEALGAKIAQARVTLPARAGEEGKLFGAVTSRDVAEALEKAGFAIDRKLVLLPDPIKQLGEYKVKVRLSADIVPEVAVSVVAQE